MTGEGLRVGESNGTSGRVAINTSSMDSMTLRAGSTGGRTEGAQGTIIMITVSLGVKGMRRLCTSSTMRTGGATSSICSRQYLCTAVIRTQIIIINNCKDNKNNNSEKSNNGETQLLDVYADKENIQDAIVSTSYTYK